MANQKLTYGQNLVDIKTDDREDINKIKHAYASIIDYLEKEYSIKAGYFYSIKSDKDHLKYAKEFSEYFKWKEEAIKQTVISCLIAIQAVTTLKEYDNHPPSN